MGLLRVKLTKCTQEGTVYIHMYYDKQCVSTRCVFLMWISFLFFRSHCLCTWLELFILRPLDLVGAYRCPLLSAIWCVCVFSSHNLPFSSSTPYLNRLVTICSIALLCCAALPHCKFSIFVARRDGASDIIIVKHIGVCFSCWSLTLVHTHTHTISCIAAKTCQGLHC